MDRAVVCRTANYLVSSGMSRPDAFRAARGMAKKGSISKVAGVTHEGRQRLISRLTTYKPEQVTVTLQRETANIFDPNAIAVVASVQGKGCATVGYLPALVARKLAQLLTEVSTKTALEGIVGGYDGLSYGLRLRIAI